MGEAVVDYHELCLAFILFVAFHLEPCITHNVLWASPTSYRTMSANLVSKLPLSQEEPCCSFSLLESTNNFSIKFVVTSFPSMMIRF